MWSHFDDYFFPFFVIQYTKIVEKDSPTVYLLLCFLIFTWVTPDESRFDVCVFLTRHAQQPKVE